MGISAALQVNRKLKGRKLPTQDRPSHCKKATISSMGTVSKENVPFFQYDLILSRVIPAILLKSFKYLGANLREPIQASIQQAQEAMRIIRPDPINAGSSVRMRSPLLLLMMTSKTSLPISGPPLTLGLGSVVNQ